MQLVPASTASGARLITRERVPGQASAGRPRSSQRSDDRHAVVDDDIRADDFERVLWALSVRYDPYGSSEMIKPRRSTPLDSAVPIESRPICSRIIMDACTPFEWENKTMGPAGRGDKEDRQERWARYGI